MGIVYYNVEWSQEDNTGKPTWHSRPNLEWAQLQSLLNSLSEIGFNDLHIWVAK